MDEGCLHVDVLVPALAAVSLLRVPVPVPAPAAVAVAVLVQAGPHHDVHQDPHLGEFYCISSISYFEAVKNQLYIQ